MFLWSSDVNFKGPHSEAFFSPHQDSTYAGLAPAEHCCTIWVALTAADEASGALAFAPVSGEALRSLGDAELMCGNDGQRR